ncbi:MAG: hypothetical protein ABJE66_17530 [Deltaproteobacteria bacterium]
MRLYLVASLLVLPACPLLDVQAQVQEVCLTYRGVTIPGVPVGQTSIDQSFTFDQLQGAKDLADADAQLTFTHAEVRAVSGVSDFSFVQTADLSIASGDPNSTLPTVSVFDCEGCGTSAAALDVDNAATVPVQDYIKTGSLIVTIALQGTPPANDWVADVDVCMTGNISYKVSP